MFKFEVLDYEVFVEGKKRATFESIDDARDYAHTSVFNGAERADVINAFTGEVLYHFYEHCTREVREGF